MHINRFFKSGLLVLLLQSCAEKPVPIKSKRPEVVLGTQLILTNGVYRGIEANSGKIYMVENNLQTLTAYQNNKIIWSVDISKLFMMPVPGKNQIRSIGLMKNAIEVSFGKHCYIWVDTATGKINDLECD